MRQIHIIIYIGIMMAAVGLLSSCTVFRHGEMWRCIWESQPIQGALHHGQGVEGVENIKNLLGTIRIEPIL